MLNPAVSSDLNPPTIDIDSPLNDLSLNPPSRDIQSGLPDNRSLLVEVSNRLEFYGLPAGTQAAENVKLNFLTFDREVSKNFTNLPNEFYYSATQTYYGGVVLAPTKNRITPLRNLFEDFSTLIDYLSPGLSEATKKTICEAAYREDDRNLFIDMVSETVKNILISRDVLGSFYDTFHNRMIMATNLSTNRVLGYLDRFRESNPLPDPVSPVIDVYERHVRKFRLVDLSGNITELKTLKIQQPIIQAQNDFLSSKIKNLICLKAEAMHNTDAVVMNDLMFVEVNR